MDSFAATRVNIIELEPGQRQKKDSNQSRPGRVHDNGKNKCYNG